MIKVSFFLSISIIIISSIFNNSINFCSRLIISAISKKKNNIRKNNINNNYLFIY